MFAKEVNNMILSPCGVNCEECSAYEKTCKGCREIAGRVWWAEYISTDICPIYKCCVNGNNSFDCGKCKQLPCKLYFDLKDPAITDEEHLVSINARTKLLKSKL